MKTPLEQAAEHARAYVRNRGWRYEPLSWEEVEVLLEEVETRPMYVFRDCACEEVS